MPSAVSALLAQTGLLVAKPHRDHSPQQRGRSAPPHLSTWPSCPAHCTWRQNRLLNGLSFLPCATCAAATARKSDLDPNICVTARGPDCAVSETSCSNTLTLLPRVRFSQWAPPRSEAHETPLYQMAWRWRANWKIACDARHCRVAGIAVVNHNPYKLGDGFN